MIIKRTISLDLPSYKNTLDFDKFFNAPLDHLSVDLNVHNITDLNNSSTQLVPSREFQPYKHKTNN